MREYCEFYKFTRQQAAELFVATYMECSTPEERERLVEWWNADQERKGR